MLHLTAEYPLGTFAGRGQSGELEEFPTPDRLLAALLAAAGSGTRAVKEAGLLMPSQSDLDLLEWFEVHPPDRMTVPRTLLPQLDGQVTAYRKQGTLAKGKYAPPRSAIALERVALDGPISWSWHEFPSERVEDLCEIAQDVGYIGPADSPCVLRVKDAEPQGWHLVRQIDADPFVVTPHVSVPVPAPGRLAAWIDAHVARSKNPNKDSNKRSEEPRIDRWIDGVNRERYVPENHEVSRAGALPWDSVIVLQTASEAAVRMDDLTRVAVQAHRALISILGARGRSVDSWITGKSLPGAQRPANHLAIHYVPRTDKANITWHDDATGALLLLLPAGLSADGLETIDLAVRKMRVLRVTRSSALRVVHVEKQSPETFWKPPAVGQRRLWMTWPAAVADRVVRGDDFATAVRRSVAHVWRDLPCDASAVTVESVRRVQRNARNYVHRMNAEALRMVYRATLDMGSLVAPGQLVALGQSRHVGGGLLVPLDESAEVRDASE